MSSQLKEFGASKIHRFSSQIGEYIKGFNRKINETMCLLLDLSTKIINATDES